MISSKKMKCDDSSSIMLILFDNNMIKIAMIDNSNDDDNNDDDRDDDNDDDNDRNNGDSIHSI